MYYESFTEKELREVSREVIDIIKGKSKFAGTRPFYRGNWKLNNTLVQSKVNYKNRNIGMFNIIKDWSKRGSYILEAQHYFDGKPVFQIPFTTKTTAAELYILIAEAYDQYDSKFNEYSLNLTNKQKLIFRTEHDKNKLEQWYIGNWHKENKWYQLVVKGEENNIPKCESITAI